MIKHWWKILCVLILGYVITAGFIFSFPDLPILNETIRNVFFHIPMWYAMIVCFVVSGVFSVLVLAKDKYKADIQASSFAFVGIFFGCMGMLTGMEWATVTWGEPWSNDPKQVGSALCLLSYLAYWVLRNSIKDEDKQRRVSAVYNVFALAMLFPLLFIIPAHSKSLHPGTDGNNFQALYEQASHLRKVSLPAMFGWILLATWITTLVVRTRVLQYLSINKESYLFDFDKKQP
jgi:heme exporter protein C